MDYGGFCEALSQLGQFFAQRIGIKTTAGDCLVGNPVCSNGDFLTITNGGANVILEGIHSLNPDVIRIPDEKTAKIYVSVRTRITNNSEILHPSKIRLMRRMVRDRLFRKRSLSDTLMMFRSVEEGENKYIMPYKYRSTYDVDTFMAYEICAYRDCLLGDLLGMTEPELQDATAFLADAAAMPDGVLSPNSLIREFVGS